MKESVNYIIKNGTVEFAGYYKNESFIEQQSSNYVKFFMTSTSTLG
jgi:hypothetical protein